MTTRFGEFWQFYLPERSAGFLGLGLRMGLGVLMLGLLTASSAWGQDIRGGLRVGPSFGFLNDRALPFVSTKGATRGTPHARVDGHAGAFGIVGVTERTSLEFDLLFLRKGGHFSSLEEVPSLGPVYISEQVQLSYLQGQLLARRDVWPSGPLSFHAVVGVSLDRALSGQLSIDVRTPLRVTQWTLPLVDRDLVSRWGVGAVVGGSVGYPLGRARRIAVDVRYNPGFGSVFGGRETDIRPETTLLNAPDPLTDSGPNLRHDVLTLGISYTLPLLNGRDPQ